MDTLFDVDEFFQKERPTGLSKEQEEAFYLKMATEIIDENYSDSRPSEIIEDLKTLFPFMDGGYEMAQTLEDEGEAYYDIDADFIGWLEDLHYRYSELKEENIKIWVRVHKPIAKFKKGQKLIVDKFLSFNLKTNTVFFITGFKEDMACYLVHTDLNYKGGYVIAYERIEENCRPIE